jgi:predicted NBD/HSP70 family sugar kinase
MGEGRRHRQDRAWASLAVVDLNGHFLSRQLVPLSTNVATSIHVIATAMETLRAQHPEKTFEGVGLSVSGRIDPVTNRLALVPNSQWKDYDVRGELAKRLCLRVELENDANACLLSELWFGHLDGLRNVVLLAISEGLGAAVLAEGRLISGRDGLASEFGHICVDPSGPLCGCGKRGCWEVFASSQAALRHYAECVPENGKITMTELIALALNHDASAMQALHRQSEEIGNGLRMINAALSPDAILFAATSPCSGRSPHRSSSRSARTAFLRDQARAYSPLAMVNGPCYAVPPPSCCSVTRDTTGLLTASSRRPSRQSKLSY